MKRSFRRRYHVLLMILLGIILLQSGLIWFTLSQATDLTDLVSDVQSILIIFFFAVFVYMIVIYNYVPFRLRRAFRDIGNLIEEISHGNYQIDIDSSTYDQDADIQELIMALQKMLNILMRFDMVKADKIYEHHQRITQMINILPFGILIGSVNGDVVYCNDKLREAYPSITETVNLNELIFTNPFDSRLFHVIGESMRYGKNLYQDIVADDKEDRQAAVDGSIIRNRKGVATGAVFVIHFMDNASAD